MLRKAASKVMWVGRAASTMFGLALVLALVVGAASAAFGANGDFFKLGNSNNLASAVSTLTKSGAGPALSLKVDSGAPLAVNSSSKVAKLNVDKLDGLDSTRFVEARGDINGNTVAFRGILEHSEGASFLNTGFHTVVAHAPEGPPVDVLLSCPSQASAGTLRIVNNTTEFGDSQRVWVDDDSANPSFNTLGQNGSTEKTVSPTGDHFTIQVKSVFGTNRMATMDLFTEQFGPSVCSADAHVIYTFAP
jgi:ABC-type antimicrobial peptide transport system permease subunit